jgi:hypothetical protein
LPCTKNTCHCTTFTTTLTFSLTFTLRRHAPTQATDAGLWVILAVRSQVGAGQYYDTKPGTVVFRNETLKTMMYAMWAHVAQHYASFDRIAAYEILSEPRDKTVSMDVVREFYEGGCAAAQAVDHRTPCMVLGFKTGLCARDNAGIGIPRLLG